MEALRKSTPSIQNNDCSLKTAKLNEALYLCRARMRKGVNAAESGPHCAALVDNLFVNNVHLHVASLLGMLAAAQPRTTKAAQ